MSRGLVAITNNVAAIPEFIKNDEAMLVSPEDYKGLANAIEILFFNPDIFKKISRQSPSVVAIKSGYDNTIAKEIDILNL
jgi:glycosyltransferase involved in cell wall biosynthesis